MQGKATITFTSVNPIREEFPIEFDVYSATSVLPFLPEEYRRLRLVSPLLRFEIAPGPEQTTQYRWTLHIDETGVPLDHLVRAARAMRVLLDPESPPYKLYILGRASTIDAKAAKNFGVPDDTLAMLDAAIDAGVVARSFDLALDHIQVQPDALVRQGQDLRVLATLFGGSTPDVSLTHKTTRRELHGKRAAHVVVLQVRIGDRILLASIGLVGTASWAATDEGGELSLSPSIRVLERACIAAGTHELGQFHEQIVQPMVDRGEALLNREGLAVLRVDRSSPEAEKD